MIVLSGVDEIAVYGVELKGWIEILDRVEGSCQCLPYNLTSIGDRWCKLWITPTTIVVLINHWKIIKIILIIYTMNLVPKLVPCGVIHSLTDFIIS
jgi:hypothetical protein